MKFKTLEQIRVEFKIKSLEKESIKKDLLKILKEVHPDKNGGEPKNKTEKELVLNLTEALNFIDSLSDETSLVAVSKQMTDIIQYLVEERTLDKTNQIEQKLDVKIQNNISESVKFTRKPKIALTTVTAALGFVILLPEQVLKIPNLAKIIDPSNSTFQILWLVTLFYTLILWIFIYFREERNKITINSLKLESTQNDLFLEYLYFLGENINHNQAPVLIFSKIEFVNFIMKKYNRYRYLQNNLFLNLLTFFKPPVIQEDVAQDIVEIIIKRALEMEIIEKYTQKKSLGMKYKVLDKSILEESRNFN